MTKRAIAMLFDIARAEFAVFAEQTVPWVLASAIEDFRDEWDGSPF